MAEQSKTALFEEMPVPETVMKLAVPIMMSSLVMVICNLSDTYFVGILNDPIQNAAVTLAAPVLLAFNAVNNLFCGILFSAIYTIFSGSFLNLLGTSSDTVVATAGYLRWTVTCGAVLAILNVVMAYLVRSEGVTLHASIGTMSGCLLNILLDPVFILPRGFNMGATGAGLATFLSNCVACIYFLFCCL